MLNTKVDIINEYENRVLFNPCVNNFLFIELHSYNFFAEIDIVRHFKDNLLTYIGKVYQKSLILQKISKCHLPKQHFRNFLSLAKPGELVVRRSNDRTQWRRRMFGQESITFTLEKVKETLDSFNRLKDILEFRTNQLFIELVVQTINSSQNKETRGRS